MYKTPLCDDEASDYFHCHRASLMHIITRNFKTPVRSVVILLSFQYCQLSALMDSVEIDALLGTPCLLDRIRLLQETHDQKKTNNRHKGDKPPKRVSN